MSHNEAVQHAPEKGISERYRLKPLAIAFALFMLLAIAGSVFTPTKGLFCYLILPGYFLLLNLELDDLERVILSTAVGISLLPLIFFNLSLFWVRMFLPVIWIAIISVVILGVVLKEKDTILSKLGLRHRLENKE
jgi:uncharacterized membrane protein